jgi:hypothetical protein
LMITEIKKKKERKIANQKKKCETVKSLERRK